MQIEKAPRVAGLLTGMPGRWQLPLFQLSYSAIPALKFGRERFTADGMILPLPCV